MFNLGYLYKFDAKIAKSFCYKVWKTDYFCIFAYKS